MDYRLFISGYVHLDLKCDNILYEYNEEEEKRFMAFISDFGLNEGIRSFSKGKSGTNGFIPSEMVETLIYSAKNDIYFFGKTIIEFFCAPYYINKSIKNKTYNSLSKINKSNFLEENYLKYF